MSSVGRRINQHIVRLLLQTAFDHGLQVLVFRLKFLETQIVHIDDKLIIPVLDLRHHVIQIMKLMLIELNDAQPSVIIFIGDRFDAGGLARPRISEQQTVVRFSPRHKCLRVLDQLLLRDLISDQIIQLHMGDIADRHDLHARFRMFHAKCFM